MRRVSSTTNPTLVELYPGFHNHADLQQPPLILQVDQLPSQNPEIPILQKINRKAPISKAFPKREMAGRSTLAWFDGEDQDRRTSGPSMGNPKANRPSREPPLRPVMQGIPKWARWQSDTRKLAHNLS